jgi:hypothetical protein
VADGKYVQYMYIQNQSNGAAKLMELDRNYCFTSRSETVPPDTDTRAYKRSPSL